MPQINFYWDGELESFASVGMESTDWIPTTGDQVWLRRWEPEDAPPENRMLSLVPACVVDRRLEVYQSGHDSFASVSLFLQRVNK